MEAGLFQYPTEVINLEAVLLGLQKTQTQNSRVLCEEGLQSMAVGRRQVSLQKAQKMQPLLQSWLWPGCAAQPGPVAANSSS